MLEESLYVFEYKDLRLALFHHTSKFSEKCSACIFKTSLLTNNREGLARCTSYKQVYLPTIRFGIEIMDVIMPLIFCYIIIREV